MRVRHSVFSKALRCLKSWLPRRLHWKCLPWRCWIETAFMAVPVSISPRKRMASRRISEQRSQSKVQSPKSKVRSKTGKRTLDIGRWTNSLNSPKRNVLNSTTRPQSHRLSKSLSLDHVDEVACAEACQAG